MVRERRASVWGVGVATCLLLLVAAACGPKPPKTATHPVRLDLWVMSQCPFGVHAETLLGKVVGAMGPLVDWRIHFIVEAGEGGKLASLHGEEEVRRDRVQACVGSLYPKDQLNFILAWNAAPKSDYAGIAALYKLDAEKIRACAEGDEGDALLRAMVPESEQAKVTSSPTIFLDGKLFDGHRSSLGIVEKVCELRAGEEEFTDLCLRKPSSLTFTDSNADGAGKCAGGEGPGAEGAVEGAPGGADAAAWKAFLDTVDRAPYDVTAVVPTSDPGEAWTEMKNILNKSLPAAKVREVPYPSPEADKLLRQYQMEWVPALFFDKALTQSPVYRAGKPFFAERGDRLVGNPILWGADRNVARTASPGTLDVYYKIADERNASAIPAIAGIVAEKGRGKKTAIRFRPAIVIGQGSEPGAGGGNDAEIAECARQIAIAENYPERFGAYVGARLGDAKKDAEWEKAATAAGINPAEVTELLQDRRYVEGVKANAQAVGELEVLGPLAFVLDNQRLIVVKGRPGLEELLDKLP
jgi:2-hydroxychromene-2-carboxylate isomerase